MASWLYFLNLIFITSNVLCVNTEQCDFSDEVCVTHLANYIFKIIVAGNQSLGIEKSEPLYMKRITANPSSDIYYTFTDVFMYGMKDCVVQRLKLITESIWYYDLICPTLIIKANYIETGVVASAPFESEGKVVIVHDNYHVGVQGYYETVIGSDGISHMNITSHLIYKLEPKDNVIYKFTNLFSTDKEKSEMTHKFINDNWRKVSDNIKFPLMQPMISQYVNNINKFLSKTPKYAVFYRKS